MYDNFYEILKLFITIYEKTNGKMDKLMVIWAIWSNYNLVYEVYDAICDSK